MRWIESGAAILAAVFLFSCVSEGPRELKWVSIDSAERDSRCVVLSKELADALSFENSKSTTLDHGRLGMYAEIRNRGDSPLKVEYSVAFRDDTGVVVDETVWTIARFTPNQTFVLRKSSLGAAKEFTVRIRIAAERR